MIKTILFIALGGALGSVLRFLSTVAIHKYWSSAFPLATLVINCLGCFCIGFFIVIIEKQNLLHTDLKWFLITGFCGGYTTFSAFGLENIQLLESQNMFLSLAYIVLSVVVGIAFVWLGMLTGKLL